MNYILIETDLTGYPDTRLLFPQLQPRNEFHKRVNWHLMDELDSNFVPCETRNKIAPELRNRE